MVKNRRKLIAANWKMNLGRFDEALAFVRAARPALTHIADVDVVLCPPYTVLAALAEVLKPSPIALGAQDLHWEAGGAHTGAIAADMLRGSCRFVLIGHSERRATRSLEETDRAVNRKVHAALAADLTPIVCVGEDSDQNSNGETERVVGGQISSAIDGLSPEHAAACLFAYEPIWAIGSGKAATPSDANRVMGLFIRARLDQTFGSKVAESVRLLYGGSVTAANIAEFMVMPEIDGALVGGASLDAKGFVDLVSNARL